jgi:cell division protein FtsQ
LAISISRPADPPNRTVVGHRGLRLWVAVVVLGLLVAVGVLSASHSRLFHLRDLEVTGQRHLGRREVVRLSGLTSSTNVLWLDPREVERRLETDPWVAGASVSRSLPGTVQIAIVERTPVAAHFEGGRFRLIAGDGTSLGAAARAGGLPLIVTPPPDEVPAPDVAGAARAIALMQPEVRAEVRDVLVGVDGTMDLEVAGGLLIHYGLPVALEQKAEALRGILGWAREQGSKVQVVDLTAPSHPAAVLAP